MKRKTKITLIVGALLLLAGCIVCFAALASVGFDFTQFSTTTTRSQEHVTCTTDTTQEITIQASTQDIRLLPSSDEQAHFIYENTDDETFLVEQTQEQIRLTQHSAKKKWYEYISLDFSSKPQSVDIYLPANFQGSVTIFSDTSDITLSSIADLSDLSIHVDTGEISLRDLHVSTLSLNTSTGDIEIAHVSAQSATIAATTGETELDHFAAATAAVTTTSGDISFDQLDAQALNLYTDTGDIEGTLLGTMESFTITSETVTGENQLPTAWGTGEKRLDVRTSSGDIEIAFSNPTY